MLNLTQAYHTAALASLSMQAFVELSEEASALCAREIFFKASLIEASAAPEPNGAIKEQAQANLAAWVARPFLNATRLATIRATFLSEMSSR